MGSQPRGSNGVDARIPDRIRGLRQARGFTLVELGRMVGMHGSGISKVEHGQRCLTVGEAAALAEACGVSLSDLVSPKPLKVRTVEVQVA